MLQFRLRLYALLHLVVLCGQHNSLSRPFHVARIHRQRQPFLGRRIERLQRGLFGYESIIHMAQLAIFIVMGKSIQQQLQVVRKRVAEPQHL